MIDDNASDVSDWFEAELDELEEGVEKMQEQAVTDTKKAALSKVPVETGRLRDDISASENSVYNTLDYAPHVGLGTVRFDGTDYLYGPANEAITKALKDLAS